MRVDIVTIFPDYLAALDLSLVGKARRDGLIDVRVHDLRNWTEDRHRTVDDSPMGGGAGMVMRPDIWGLALDEILDGAEAAPDGAAEKHQEETRSEADGAAPDGGPGRRVLMIPTPSGKRLTQRDMEDLTGATQIVIACGRYEGIDARVAEHYEERGDVQVREFSLGDYVLNGGEVAALVVVEGVARLLPGMVGNPESLVEESHGEAGLLEYPVYTRPPSWRDRDVPPVLLSGDHGKVARWRRDRALERTARRRPDMMRAMDPSNLDRKDFRTLLAEGYLASADSAPQRFVIEHPTAGDAAALADLAAETFPLACPPGVSDEDIAEFVSVNLTEQRFAEYLGSPHRYHLLVVRTEDGEMQAYTLSVLPQTPDEGPYAEDVAKLIPFAPLVEISKFYVRQKWHGSGISSLLMERLLEELDQPGVAPALGEDACVAGSWLGTNARNGRAAKFYQKTGFVVMGPRRFTVGHDVHDDICLWRARPSEQDEG